MRRSKTITIRGGDCYLTRVRTYMGIIHGLARMKCWGTKKVTPPGDHVSCRRKNIKSSLQCLPCQSRGLVKLIRSDYDPVR